MSSLTLTDLSRKISKLLNESRQGVIQAVNHTMIITYFEIGRMIVEEEQNGKEMADHGSQLLSELSRNLTTEFGKGFSVTNLKQMRQFYLVYFKNAIDGKGQTLSDLFKSTSS